MNFKDMNDIKTALSSFLKDFAADDKVRQKTASLLLGRRPKEKSSTAAS